MGSRLFLQSSRAASSNASQWRIQDCQLGGGGGGGGGRIKQTIQKGVGAGGGNTPPASARGYGGAL